jgi:hypothetical protein
MARHDFDIVAMWEAKTDRGTERPHPTQQFKVRCRMTLLGHEERLPPLSLSDRSGFREGTFAGTRGNDEDAPVSAIGLPVRKASC